MKTIFFLFALLLSSLSFSQSFTKGTATLNSGKSLQGKIAIDNSKNVVLVKNGFDTQSYAFSQVNELELGDDKYTRLSIDEDTYIAQPLTQDGAKASLYKIGGNAYLVSNGDTSKSFNTEDEQHLIPGYLSLLFNDCNTIRSTIEKEDKIAKRELISITNQYNSCAYSAYAPTDTEVARATKHNTDQASFYVGLGSNLNNVSFFDNDDTESLIGAQLRFGVLASPSFLGNLQGNLFVFLEGSANFAGDKDFSNNTDPVNFSTNSYRAQLGFEYLFNKTGRFKPIIGLGIGAASDAFSGSISDNSFDIDGGNPFVAPRLGVRFKLKNDKHIGLMVEYITSYENDLTFPTPDAIIPLEVGSQNIGVGINYYF